MKMKALCIGHTTYDISLPVNGYPLENGKYYLKEKFESSGGGASNAAFLLAKWNVETFFSGVVGYDDFGTFIKKEMEKGNIKTSFLETNYDKKTSTSFILINQENHTRTIFNVQPEEFHLKKYEYDMVPDLIYLDGYEYSASVTAMNKYSNAISFLDASLPTKNLMALARDVKYLLCSIEFAEGVAGAKIDFNNPVTLLTVYKRVKDRFPKSEIIITLKQHGALYCVNNEVKQMPPLAVAEVDRTAAGDIFRAAFSYAIGSHYDLEKAVRVANIAAGLSTAKLGGKESIPTLSEIKNHYETRFGPIETKNEVDSISQKEIENNPSVNSPSFNNVSTNSQISTQQNNGMPPINPTMNAFLNNQAPVNTPNNSQTPPNTP